MKNYLLLVLMLFGILSVSYSQSDQGATPGIIRIKLSPELVSSGKGIQAKATNGILVTGIAPLDKLNAQYGASQMQRVFKYSDKYEERHRKHGLHQWYEIKISDKLSPSEVAKAYKNVSGVLVAETKSVIKLHDFKSTPVTLTTSSKKREAMPFNDPGLTDQWHYNNTGQAGGTMGMDINLFKAWIITTGKSNVIVSVHDMGVDYTHEDLAQNMWVNNAEKNGIKGKDDDGNGFIDDIHGFNFTTNYGELDKGDHGTHVAGTIAAKNNNNLGVGGIAGGTDATNGVRIMSCEIIGSQGGDPAESYIYAADNGAVISQNSWGYPYSEGDQALYDAMDYFIAEAGNFPNSPMKGGIIIFASGNDNTDYPNWPGAYEKVLSVSALGARGEKAEYSNFGSHVDLAAPGGSSNITPKQGVLSTVPGNRYAYMDGTSMACPHVSGVAALVVSKFGGSNFTVNELYTHLTTGIRKDIYEIELNADYPDLLGLGLIDASFALATDNKIAPAIITDLQLDGISQDFANISWSMPSDYDDGKASRFEVWVSTEDQFVFAKKFDLNSTAALSEKINFEVTGLTGLTKYYFTVLSIDRWGNKSEISNIISATTNAGPVTITDPEVLPELVIFVDQSKTGNLTFNVGNTGEGILKYTVKQFHKSNTDTYSNKNITYPPVLKTLNYARTKIGGTEHKGNQVINPLNQNFINVEKGYSYSNNGYIIGETDTTFTNSSALRFYVNETEGFNLTQVTAMLKLDISRGPAVIEIYQGKEIDAAKLVYAQNYTPNSWYNNKVANHSIQLNNQLFFETGSYFWIVIHTPSGQLYPLGAGIADEKAMSENAYISNNLGKSWSKLVDVYWDNRLVWKTYAVSTLEPLHTYITLSSDNGIIENGEANQSIDINVNADELINGTYNENILVYTNQPGKPFIELPLMVHVNNQQPKLILPEIVDFGSVVVGEEKSLDIVLANIGLGKIKNITIDFSNNTSSELINNSWISDISAKGEVTLDVTYKPVSAGVLSSVVTISGTNQDSPMEQPVTYTFVINAVAIDPPVANLTPATASYPGLDGGDVVNGSVTISNIGVYPLKYYVPGKAQSNLNTENNYVHKFGYSFTSDPGQYNWVDISTTGIKVNNKVNDTWVRNSLYQVPLNFSFPFFGQREDSIYLTRFGILAFDKMGTFSRTPLVFKDIDEGWGPGNPERFISAFGVTSVNLAIGGNVYYKHFVDKFIVQWDNLVEQTWMGPGGTITFQIVLFENGDIHYYYKDNTWDSYTIQSSALIDIEDLTLNDGLLISDNQWDSPMYGINIPMAGDAFIIRNPGLGIITSVDKPTGVVVAGSSATINYTIDTKNLAEGNYTELLNFVTNDPVGMVASHAIDLSIISGGTYATEISTDALHFGTTPVTGNKQLTVSLKNTGTKNITITDAQINNGNFIITESYTDLKCGRTLPFVIDMNTAAVANLSSTLTITTDEPKTYTVTLDGVIVEKAGISANITDITETLESGATKDISFEITNTGNNDLEYNPIGNQWLIVDQSNMISNSSNFNYTVSSSSDAVNPATYDWIDISKTGTKLELNYDDYSQGKIKMPWSFEFYGNKYDSLYVAIVGLLSFEEIGLTDIFMGPQHNIPNTTGPNNIIAPIYSFGGVVDSSFFAGAGYFYQFIDNMLVIQFHGMYNNFGMGDPMINQVILYKDGRIKFQYKTVNFINLQNGQVAIENADGTKGVEIMYRNMDVVKAQTAYVFTPYKNHVLAAGQTHTINAKLNAENVYAGTYNGTLLLHNNTPDNPEFSIPATLTVTGEANMETSSDSVNFGKVFFYKYYDEYSGEVWKSYTKDLYIKNTGKANLIINSMYTEFQDVPLAMTGQVTYDPFWGYSFTDVAWLAYPMTVLPNDSLMVTVQIFEPGTTSLLEGPFSDISTRLMINYGAGIDAEIPITAQLQNPPLVSVDKDEISITTNDTLFTTTDFVNVLNTQTTGGGDLIYSLDFTYERGTAKTSANTTSEKTTSVAKNAMVTSVDLKQVPVTAKPSYAQSAKESYNRTLEYETATTPDNRLGYGGNYQFASATAFTAPADGFNLTHVSTWYVPEALQNSRIYVEVRAGSNIPDNAKVIHTQYFDYVSNTTDEVGKTITVKLDNAVLLYPNETFYVIFFYPLQVALPQAITKVQNTVYNRYFYLAYADDGVTTFWSDLAQIPDFALAGYMVKAYEQVYASKAWVVLDPNTQNSGTISPDNGSQKVNMLFNAQFAFRGNNKANLRIKSNDPLHSEKMVKINLYLNQGPIFADGDTLELFVKETEVLNYKAKLADVEGNTYTVSAETLAGVTTTVNANDVVINFTPNFADHGIKMFKINAVDEHNAKSQLVVKINVINVNRDPIALALNDTILYVNGNELHIPYNTVFSDPDSDEMNYTYSISSKNYVDIATGYSSFSFKPMMEGDVTVTLYATDTLDAQVNTTLHITVLDNALPQQISDMPDQVIEMDSEKTPLEVSLKGMFTDTDKDILTYSANAFNSNVATVTMDNNSMYITPQSLGVTNVELTVNDGKQGVITTTFSVTVTSLNGKSETGIDAENAFTPNGDGVNDYWIVKNTEAYATCEFFIYSSIGELIYNSFGYTNNWEGSFNGEKLPSGTYYFVVKYPDGSIDKGTIALIR